MHIDPDATVCECQIAEHKFEVREFKTYLGTANALQQKIQEAVEDEWLEGICHQAMGFVHLTPTQRLDHLKQGGVFLNFIDILELIMQLTKTWDGNESPET